MHKSVPNCVCPFNTYTAGGVVVFIYYINQTDLHQSYIFLLNGLQLTRGIIRVWCQCDCCICVSCFLFTLFLMSYQSLFYNNGQAT